MAKPAPERRRPKVDAATFEIIVDNRFLDLDGSLPDGQGANIRACFNKAMKGWCKPFLRRNQLGRPVDQAATFQLGKDVDEFAAREAAKEQTMIVAVLHGKRRRHIAPTFAVVRARAADQPTGPVAAPPKGDSNFLSAHRDTAKARLAMV